MTRLNYYLNRTGLTVLFLLLMVVTNSCKKVDDLLQNALNFEGVFKSSDGWEIQLEQDSNKEGKATVIKVGTQRGSVTMKAGANAGFGLKPIGNNTWKGYAWDYTFTKLHPDSKISISGSTLTIHPSGGTAYTFTKTTSTGSSPTPGTNPTPGTGTGTSQVIVNTVISGNTYDKKYYRFTLPTGVKSMQIRTTEGKDPNVYFRNSADMFVRKGSDPTVNGPHVSPYKYTWVADCASIKPNREDEVCTFTNPASGQWSVLLYGYNTYFTSNLVVTITK